MITEDYISISIKIREDGDISWLKNTYEQFKNKDYCNVDDINLYKELLGHGSQDVDTFEN